MSQRGRIATKIEQWDQLPIKIPEKKIFQNTGDPFFFSVPWSHWGLDFKSQISPKSFVF